MSSNTLNASQPPIPPGASEAASPVATHAGAEADLALAAYGRAAA